MMPIQIPGKNSEMFRPPVNRAMRVLDRSFFKKNVPLSAAQVRDRKQISKLRIELQKDVLKLERMQIVQNVPVAPGEVGKALLLRPEIRSEGAWTLLG